jgi:signal peptide peptidase SppA
VTDKTNVHSAELPAGAVIWLGKDERSYYDLLSKELEAQGLKLSFEEMKELAYVDREEDEFQGYGHMINLLDNGIAVIPISGSMSNRETLWSRIFGTASYEGISNAIMAAAMHNDVQAILLDWDSPGGTVKGINTAGDTIKALRKEGLPIWSYTGGEMMSAAVWIGTAAEKVYASKDAEVGSIGVVAVHRDMSKYFADQGIKHTIMRAGKEKALVNPFEPLSPEAKAFIDKRLKVQYGRFIDEVASNRGQTPAYIRANAAEGQEFSAEDAKAVHLVDKVVSFDETVNALLKRVQRKSKSPSIKQTFGAFKMAGKEQIDPNASAATLVGAGLTAEAAAQALADKGVKPDGQDPEGEGADTPAAADSQAGKAGDDAGGDAGGKAGDKAGDDAGGEAGDDSGGSPAKPAAENGEASIIAGLLKEAQKENRELSLQLSKLEASQTESVAVVAAYRDLAIKAIAGMRIGLGRSGDVDDLKDAGDLTVVGAYKSLHAEVVSAFPTQQASRASKEEGTPVSESHLAHTLAKVTSFSRSRGA